VEWVVEVPAGSSVELEVRHQRAGTLRRDLPLR
jgi:hypothetical protein